MLKKLEVSGWLTPSLGVARFSRELTGTDPRIGSGGHNVTHHARLMRDACETLPMEGIVCHAGIKLPSFFEAEELGTLPQAHCERCTKTLSKCKDCSYRGQVLNREQREVVKRVESSMMLSQEDRKIHVSYPFKETAYLQSSNYGQAVMIQRNIEKRLARDNLTEAYDAEMMKAVRAGSVMELPEDVMKDWEGPVHYLTHFPVLKPGSTTTKVRIVANSKMKNQNTKLSLNDVVEPGPNSLNPLLEVLILFRGLEVGLLFDLCKAYQQLKTGEMERQP